MSQKTNTHYYDGKLPKLELEDLPLSFLECVEEIRAASIDSKYKNLLNAALNLVSIDRKNNYDPKNDLHFEKLLPYIWNKIKLSDDQGVKELFFEQLADITRGPCSQGRTTRIYQFI